MEDQAHEGICCSVPLADLTERRAETAWKLAQVRAVLAARSLDAVALTSSADLAWLTAGGAAYVNEATDAAVASIVVTADDAVLITNPIEAPRLTEEEGLGDLGLRVVLEPWHAPGTALATLLAGRATGQNGIGAGMNLATDLRTLRVTLLPAEMQRYRRVCRLAAEAMEDAMATVRPGQTEYQAAASLAAAARLRGGQAVVTLVASDDRVRRYRHPLPTAKTIERYAMLVLCYRQDGLIASLTRLVHFGPIPQDLRAREMVVARVDAAMLRATQPGRTLGDMFDTAKMVYTQEGFPDALNEHHQGGSTAYATREALARPGDPTPITLWQAFAWNPSVAGVKSEDTVALTADGTEILTEIPGWPAWPIPVGDITIARPAILER